MVMKMTMKITVKTMRRTTTMTMLDTMVVTTMMIITMVETTAPTKKIWIITFGDELIADTCLLPLLLLAFSLCYSTLQLDGIVGYLCYLL
jgi:hypothetical protein